MHNLLILSMFFRRRMLNDFMSYNETQHATRIALC
jgi:hypothetical protein